MNAIELKQQELDTRYIRMANIWAENSYCIRRKVGALIVKDKMIISDGYNGTPSGFENICEDEQNLTKPYVLHVVYFVNQQDCQHFCKKKDSKQHQEDLFYPYHLNQKNNLV